MSHYQSEAKSSQNEIQSAESSSRPRYPVSHLDYGETVHFGKVRVYRNDLIAVFRGDFHPVIHPPPPRKIANPVAIGVMVHGLNLFLRALSNIHAKGLQKITPAYPQAIFVGGIGCIAAFNAPAYIANICNHGFRFNGRTLDVIRIQHVTFSDCIYSLSK
jgi:hypothetical protein